LFRGPILSIFGESFAGGSAALAILAWGNLVNTGTGVCGVILNMTEKTTLTLLNSVLLFILVTGLNVLLIPQWGLIGAAVASLTAVVVINLLRLLEVFILFRLLPYNSSFIKPIVAGLTALVTVWSIGQLFDTEANLVYTAISAAILLIIYSGMILLLGLSDEDRLVLARISRRLGIRLWR
jgi:O-antigen/teichoic acid export membrane protein